MTEFRIEQLPFDRGALSTWRLEGGRFSNWPVVYTISSANEVYVGETLNATARMRQHLDSEEKQGLKAVRIVIDETFNKSACLDLESFLIRLFAADGRFKVLNRNEGITDADYFDRERYQPAFDRVFDELRTQGLFARSIPEIENTDLFKLSPFKALNQDQAIAMEEILEGLFKDIDLSRPSTSVVQGDPGTGKTIVGIFLMKLLRDIQVSNPHDKVDADSLFSDFFSAGFPELLSGFRLGLVIPQQSLRRSIMNVFRKTPALDSSMVLSPFDVGESQNDFDLLIVDEAHRLTQRANQSSGMLNKKFADVTARLFGEDDTSKTQLDWINAKSKHQIYLVDVAQSVRPADIPTRVLTDLIDRSRRSGHFYPLASQMRVSAGEGYIGFVRRLLSGTQDARAHFPGYDLRLFDDLGAMHDAIRSKDSSEGLARLVAGYAWPWRSRKDSDAHDIELDGRRLRWNSSEVDWINTQGSVDEVGSIHTVQGYDLNYAGVIIGPDLRYDPVKGVLFIDRASYHDAKGKENNKKLGVKYTDDDLIQYIANIYAVLLTRGMRGTYVYVCDPSLRRYMRKFIEPA